MIVISIDEVAKRMGVVRRTVERLIAEGEGPTVIRLSARRIGILESEFQRWLTSRQRPAAGSKEISSQVAA